MLLFEYLWNAIPLPQELFLLLFCCIIRILQVGSQSQLRSPLVLFCCTTIIITVIIIIITIIIVVIIMVITIRNHVGSDLYRQQTTGRLP